MKLELSSQIMTFAKYTRALDAVTLLNLLSFTSFLWKPWVDTFDPQLSVCNPEFWLWGTVSGINFNHEVMSCFSLVCFL